MVGLTLGGKPIDDYAPDFWLISDTNSDRVGYVTSPWWSPERNTNIALGWVPVSLSEVGTDLLVELPDEYAETTGTAVEALVAEIPFRESVNPSAREVAKSKGRDFAE